MRKQVLVKFGELPKRAKAVSDDISKIYGGCQLTYLSCTRSTDCCSANDECRIWGSTGIGSCKPKGSGGDTPPL
jgi:hypothetical protein